MEKWKILSRKGNGIICKLWVVSALATKRTEVQERVQNLGESRITDEIIDTHLLLRFSKTFQKFLTKLLSLKGKVPSQINGWL